MDLQVTLNTIATDIFRKQADYDYIAARSNYRLQLRQQFLWSSQQAIEKYLKAILLFNGKSARFYLEQGKKKEFGHNLVALANEVKTIEIFEFKLNEVHERFLNYLNIQGTNRYLVTSAYTTGNELEDLDSIVWHIRRYCQYMADRGLGCSAPVLGMQEPVVASALNPCYQSKPTKFRLFNGELEKIIKKQSTNPARKALIWANLYYGARRKKYIFYRAFSSSEVAPIHREWANVDWDEISNYIKL